MATKISLTEQCRRSNDGRGPESLGDIIRRMGGAKGIIDFGKHGTAKIATTKLVHPSPTDVMAINSSRAVG